MRNFVRVVAIGTVLVAALAFRAGSPLRAGLLLVLGLALWLAQSRSPKPSTVLLAAAGAAVIAVIGSFVGPYSLVLIDAVNATP